MAWVQVGAHKINTAVICYVEHENDTVRIYFAGEWEGNPLDLHFDEAKAFWKHLKAEDVLLTRDKGSATVMPKVRSTSGYDVHSDEQKPKPAAPSSASHSSGSHSSGSHGSHSSGSSHSSSSHSSSHSPKHSSGGEKRH